VEPEVRFETAPGVQTQADWKHIGSWPLGDEMVELHPPIPVHVLQRLAGEGKVRPVLNVVDAGLRRVGETVEVRSLADCGFRVKAITRFG
jgi:hypothetical protein